MSTDKPTPPESFDMWQQNAYTKVLQKSIAEDYVPRTDLDKAKRELAEAQTEIERAEAEVDSAYEILLSSVDLLPEKYLLYVNDLRAAAEREQLRAESFINALVEAHELLQLAYDFSKYSAAIHFGERRRPTDEWFDHHAELIEELQPKLEAAINAALSEQEGKKS